jgi:FKBP-type peptidyl-prolyl cis-trans isomerase FkpA
MNYYICKKKTMREIVVVLLCVSTLLTGCFKSDTGCPYSNTSKIAPASEEQALSTYITANNITAVKHGSNMYYQIITAGTGTTAPQLCSNIQINYTGKLTNGNVFDSQNNAVFTLGSLIEGWKYGLPLLKKGGQIRLYIPPSLGYGATDVKDQNTGNIIIPANSILIFDITLTDFQ